MDAVRRIVSGAHGSKPLAPLMRDPENRPTHHGRRNRAVQASPQTGRAARHADLNRDKDVRCAFS
jgi:hypothetical protein